jgi:hypothetical protein
MAKPAPIAIPTEPIGSIPRPVDLIERVAKGDSEDLISLLSMKMRFEIPLSGLKPQALRLLRTGTPPTLPLPKQRT